MERYNIALVFDQEVTNKIVTYARNLYEVIDSVYLLGEKSLPHMTIAQFDVEQDQAKNIWGSCESSIVDTPHIHFSGLTILPSSSGGVWIEISVLKSKKLLMIQDRIKKIIKPYGTIKNDSGDSYRPHVTIARIVTGNSLNNLYYSYEPLRIKAVHTKLGMGLGASFDSNKRPF